MRLRELIYLLGFKPRMRLYGHQIENLPLDGGWVQYARWQAPKIQSLPDLQQEVDELRQFLRPGDFAIDIGAQVGDSTLPMALACGAQGLVAAFEPNPVTYAVLGANASLNPGRTHIFPLPYAATQEDVEMTFDYSDPWLSNGGDHAGQSRWRHGSAFSIPVRGTNVETLVRKKFPECLERLRYVKIDVEGHDHMVLRSIEGLLKQYRPHIKIEVARSTPHADRVGIRDLLLRLGYALHLVVDRQRLFGPALTDAHLFGPKTIDVFARPQTP